LPGAVRLVSSVMEKGSDVGPDPGTNDVGAGYLGGWWLIEK
jgi:hypothetical protein